MRARQTNKRKHVACIKLRNRKPLLFVHVRSMRPGPLHSSPFLSYHRDDANYNDPLAKTSGTSIICSCLNWLVWKMLCEPLRRILSAYQQEVVAPGLPIPTWRIRRLDFHSSASSFEIYSVTFQHSQEISRLKTANRDSSSSNIGFFRAINLNYSSVGDRHGILQQANVISKRRFCAIIFYQVFSGQHHVSLQKILALPTSLVFKIIKRVLQRAITLRFQHLLRPISYQHGGWRCNSSRAQEQVSHKVLIVYAILRFRRSEHAMVISSYLMILKLILVMWRMTEHDGGLRFQPLAKGGVLWLRLQHALSSSTRGLMPHDRSLNLAPPILEPSALLLLLLPSLA